MKNWQWLLLIVGSVAVLAWIIYSEVKEKKELHDTMKAVRQGKEAKRLERNELLNQTDSNHVGRVEQKENTEASAQETGNPDSKKGNEGT